MPGKVARINANDSEMPKPDTIDTKYP